MVLAMLGFGASQSDASPAKAAVSGVVRDVQGTPQMGALVELLTADATTMFSTMTDDHGRYILPSVVPGRYQLRATAAFFVPATRPNLSLHAGAQAIVNLTMSTLFEAGNWLPAQKRAPGEPADDWKWTLRSTASRPLLRYVDPDSGLEMSTSSSEVHYAAKQARLAMFNGDGAFGDGGMHQVLTMDRIIEDGDGSIFRVDLGDPQVPLTVAPSVEAMAGYEKQNFGGRTRMVASFGSHPEMIANGFPGFEVMRLATTHEISLGDMVMIDVGTLLQAEKLEATRLMSDPFLSLTLRPNSDLALEYRYATGRQLQSSDDLNQLKPQTTVLTDVNGRPLTDHGSHHEISINRKVGDDRVLSVAIYRDSFTTAALMGSGAIDGATMQSAPVVSDPTTATFRLATTGYTGRGLSVAMSQKLTPVLTATAEYDLGSTLRADEVGGAIGTLKTTAHTAPAAKVALHGKLLRTGTSVKAEYRWQPLRTLTQVNAYNTTQEEAYLSFGLRQRVWCGRFLPKGMDAVVEATNLLEQGYQPFLAPDGHTLFLAQVPRAIQGGLAFNF